MDSPQTLNTNRLVKYIVFDMKQTLKRSAEIPLGKRKC